MPDPERVVRAHRAAATLEQAWDRWRRERGMVTGPMPPISSYVGYSIEEPWGRPRVVFGVDAHEAEQLAALLDNCACSAASMITGVDRDADGAAAGRPRTGAAGGRATGSRTAGGRQAGGQQAGGHTAEGHTAEGQPAGGHAGGSEPAGGHTAEDQLAGGHTAGGHAVRGNLDEMRARIPAPAPATEGMIVGERARSAQKGSSQRLPGGNRGGGADPDDAQVRAGGQAPGEAEAAAEAETDPGGQAAAEAETPATDPAATGSQAPAGEQAAGGTRARGGRQAPAGTSSGQGQPRTGRDRAVRAWDQPEEETAGPEDGADDDTSGMDALPGLEDLGPAGYRGGDQGGARPSASTRSAAAGSIAAELAGWAAGELPGQASARLAAWASVGGVPAQASRESSQSGALGRPAAGGGTGSIGRSTAAGRTGPGRLAGRGGEAGLTG